jgi:heme/copper-type cytochrome/quinol oxidase subunit 3
MEPRGSISIWFFIGISLVVNGTLILGYGIYELIQPAQKQNPIVLLNHHASVWWGALLLAAGITYCYHFLPGRKRG